MLKDYIVTLQDYDGVTVGATTYKIASGKAIDVNAVDFVINGSNFTDVKNNPNKKIVDGATPASYNDRKGYVIYAGFDNFRIILNCIIDLELAGAESKIGTKLIDFETLINLMLNSHRRFYLKDWQGFGTPDINTPLRQWLNGKDIYGNDFYDATTKSRGIPVTITNLSNIRRSAKESAEGHIMTFSLELVEDKV